MSDRGERRGIAGSVSGGRAAAADAQGESAHRLFRGADERAERPLQRAEIPHPCRDEDSSRTHRAHLQTGIHGITVHFVSSSHG